MADAILTQEELKSKLIYDPESGVFRWKERRKGIRYDKPAGHIHSATGYIKINIGKSKYQAHRLVWLYMYGYMPELLDHINGIRNDNRLCNLRAATQKQNMCNIKKHSSNTSGFKGVDYVKRDNKYRARCRSNGIRHNLGLFDTAFEASCAYNEFAKKHHGEFYRDR
jgi:hypothetical protein